MAVDETDMEMVIDDKSVEHTNLLCKHRQSLINLLEADSDLSEEWQTILAELKNDNQAALLSKSQVTERLDELETRQVRNDLVEVIRSWTAEKIKATENRLEMDVSIDSKISLDLMRNKALDSATNKQLEVIIEAFDRSELSPNYLFNIETKKRIIEDFCSDKAANAKKIKLLNEEYDKLNNDELLVVKGILEKSDLNPINIEKKNHIIKII